MSDRLIREEECRQLTGLSRSTRWRLEVDGAFPRRRRISTNSVGWLESELREWIDARPRCAGAATDESNPDARALDVRGSEANRAPETGR